MYGRSEAAMPVVGALTCSREHIFWQFSTTPNSNTGCCQTNKLENKIPFSLTCKDPLNAETKRVKEEAGYLI